MQILGGQILKYCQEDWDWRATGASGHNWDVFHLGSSSSEESEEEEVEKNEAANIEMDEESRRENDRDVVFVEHTSNANVGFNRESIVAKLKRNGNVTVGGQLVKLPVPMRKKTLEINQWQDWLTLEEQVGAISWGLV